MWRDIGGIGKGKAEVTTENVVLFGGVFEGGQRVDALLNSRAFSWQGVRKTRRRKSYW